MSEFYHQLSVVSDDCGHINTFVTLGSHRVTATHSCVVVSLYVCYHVSEVGSMRYVQHWYGLFLVLSSWSFEKIFRSKVMA